MKFSLIISTRGRVAEVKRMLQSLNDQVEQNFEVIISDQNDDDRLDEVFFDPRWNGKLIRLRNRGGLSLGRNEGLRVATGEIVGFPDDDCTYPSDLLCQVATFLASHGEYGFLSGRSYDDDGEDSVSKHSKQAAIIDRRTIHSQCIEFAIFIRRKALGELRFDENMGVGSPSPWQSDEGPDLLLRLMNKGVMGYYDPSFGAWHKRPVIDYDAKSIDRTYRYACGNGYFFRKHRYTPSFFAYQMFRTAGGMILALGTLKRGKALLYLARLRGRWRGWSYKENVGKHRTDKCF